MSHFNGETDKQNGAVVIGYTAGVFDMFHVGHLRLLERAKSQCDKLVVGVTTDELCAETKGKGPIIPYDERVEIISALRYVDEVVLQASLDKLDAWRRIGYHRTFIGSDWKGSERWNEIESYMKGTGVEIVYLPYTPHVSSSLLREVLNRLHDEE